MALSAQTDPLRATNFLVEIDGITRSRFFSVSGLGSEVDVVEEREGTDPRHSHKVAGTTHTQNLVLRWPSDDNTELTDWHQRILRANLTAGTLRSSFSTRPVAPGSDGTSSRPGPPSGRGRRSMPKATT